MHTNHVESFFSRIQRSYVGIRHRFSVKYFDWYAAEIAWREHTDVEHGAFRAVEEDIAKSVRLLGEQRAARSRLEERCQSGRDYNLACCYAKLSRSEEAIDCLERQASGSQTYVALVAGWMKNDSDLDSLRNHPRYLALANRMEAQPAPAKG